MESLLTGTAKGLAEAARGAYQDYQSLRHVHVRDHY